MNVSFNCSRVFLHFYQEGNTTQKEIITGKIGLPVYLAVKQRLLRMPYEIQLMLPSMAEMYSRKVNPSDFFNLLTVIGIIFCKGERVC